MTAVNFTQKCLRWAPSLRNTVASRPKLDAWARPVTFWNICRKGCRKVNLFGVLGRAQRSNQICLNSKTMKSHAPSSFACSAAWRNINAHLHISVKGCANLLHAATFLTSLCSAKDAHASYKIVGLNRSSRRCFACHLCIIFFFVDGAFLAFFLHHYYKEWSKRAVHFARALQTQIVAHSSQKLQKVLLKYLFLNGKIFLLLVPLFPAAARLCVTLFSWR